MNKRAHLSVYLVRKFIKFPFLSIDKAKKKYGNLIDGQEGDGVSEVLVVMLERSPGSGLGLSLSGHKDRTKMAVMVCGLNPNGPAAKSGCLQVGDEILEVHHHYVPA